MITVLIWWAVVLVALLTVWLGSAAYRNGAFVAYLLGALMVASFYGLALVYKAYG